MYGYAIKSLEYDMKRLRALFKRMCKENSGVTEAAIEGIVTNIAETESALALLLDKEAKIIQQGD